MENINDIDYIKSKLSIGEYFNKVILDNDLHYYGTTHIDFDGVGMVKCPLHDENTPSFRYFQDTESFYCFGCNRGGDVINLHRYYVDKVGSSMSLKESISYLKGLINDTSVSNLDLSLKKDMLDGENHYSLTVEDYLTIDRLSREFSNVDDTNLRAYKMYVVLLNLIDLNKIDKGTFYRTVKSIDAILNENLEE